MCFKNENCVTAKCLNESMSLEESLYTLPYISREATMTFCDNFLQIFEIIFVYFVVAIHVSLVMRKPAFCICENRDADQLRSNCAAD